MVKIGFRRGIGRAVRLCPMHKTWVNGIIPGLFTLCRNTDGVDARLPKGGSLYYSANRKKEHLDAKA